MQIILSPLMWMRRVFGNVALLCDMEIIFNSIYLNIKKEWNNLFVLKYLLCEILKFLTPVQSETNFPVTLTRFNFNPTYFY